MRTRRARIKDWFFMVTGLGSRRRKNCNSYYFDKVVRGGESDLKKISRWVG
jgi:hypothetical protein